MEKIRQAHPEHAGEAVPADLVTASGAGLDSHIFPYAAEWIARVRGLPEEEVQKIIAKCTTGRFLEMFGEPAGNALKAKLMIDGIL